MNEKVIKRKIGRPKGSKNIHGHNAGNPRTGGIKRNKTLPVKFTEEELEKVKQALKKMEGKSYSDKLLKLLNIN